MTTNAITTTPSTSVTKILVVLLGLFRVAHGLNTVSIVTGGSGFVGREIIHTLLEDVVQESILSPEQQQQQLQQPLAIISLVRPSRVAFEQRYWSHQEAAHVCPVKVMPYDMLDGGTSLQNALEMAFQDSYSNNAVGDSGCCCCVYHTASFFGPSDNHIQTALDNVQGTEDVLLTLAQQQHRQLERSSPNCHHIKLILTSSMAAVRGTNQVPLNGQTYAADDWNTISKLGGSWGSSYQWSKAESERRAWHLSQLHQVPMVALCPSFIFGPPRDAQSSNSYSISLVDEWIDGHSPVQSRLCVDVRDVARAHVAAARQDHAVGSRFLVSTDARVPSQHLAQALQDVCREYPDFGNPDQITYDAAFTGGAIPIGEPEVLATARLEQELGVTLRPVTETIADMGRALLRMKRLHQQKLQEHQKENARHATTTETSASSKPVN